MVNPVGSGSVPPILLASGNPAKQQSLGRLLDGLPLSPITPQQLELESVPEEAGDNHEAIARQKAGEWSRAASMLAIASDGGLVIPALGSNWESTLTHRFAGPSKGSQGETVERRAARRGLLGPQVGSYPPIFLLLWGLTIPLLRGNGAL